MQYRSSLRKYYILIFSIVLACLWAGKTLYAGNMVPAKSKKDSKTGGEKTAEEVYKNIKVFKGMPASQISPTMHFMEAALGFNCSNCHVRGPKGMEFDKDDKPEKRKARKMVELMNAINKENFKGHQYVTCFTCHHGSPDPAKIPGVMTVSEMQKRMSERKEEDETIKVPNRLNTAQEIVAKYVQALGGKAAFGKLTTLKMEGTFQDGGRGGASMAVYRKAPDKYLMQIKMPMGSFERGYNGNTGWMNSPRGAREIKGDDLAELKSESEFNAPIDIEKNYSKLKFNDVELLNGDTVYVVDGQKSPLSSTRFYFNTTSGLLERQIDYSQTLLGKLQTQTDYSDYKSVDGVLFPYVMNISNYERTQEIKYNNISANVPVEDKMFDQPGK